MLHGRHYLPVDWPRLPHANPSAPSLTLSPQEYCLVGGNVRVQNQT